MRATPSAFVTRSRTYRVLDRELESRIREEFSIKRGSIGACRWQNKNGDYAEWRVEVYWHDQGVLHHKILGKLNDIIARVHAEFSVD